ncbi:EpsG family protein [Pectobacterium brasiliense]|uniref:EpsG family protein n=1 Tax=Pectobacterium brasiliense TaxID=180957 RepID=UPI00227B28D7|nr:EpsG family protein [Pectobacterium brasiliense]WGL30147.1 EpsG family protein [Pectobacterium brasiliense]
MFKYFTFLVFLIASILFIPFSPIVSILFCFVSVISFSTLRSPILVLIYLLIICFDFSVIYSAKDLYGGATDFGIYYQFYNSLLNDGLGVFDSIIYNGNHFEPLYFIATKILTYILGDVSEVSFSIIMNFICFFSLSITLSIYVYRSFDVKNMLLLIFLTLFICKIGSITLFWRQSLAAAFMLLVFSFSGTKKYFFWALAFGFHFSSAVVVPVCNYILRKKNYSIYFFLSLTAIGFIWVFLGRTFLTTLVSVLGLSRNSFFINDYDFPYYVDAIKTVVFSIPVIVFYYMENKDPENRDKYFNVLLAEIFIIMAFSTVPHFFRIIYPLAVILLYAKTVYLMLKLKDISFYLCLFYMSGLGFVRLLQPDLTYQFYYFSTSPFYYFL